MTTKLPVLIAGAGPVGTFIAYRLGKAGIQVVVFEKEPEIPYSPRAVGYYGASQVVFQENGLYDLIRSEGFVTAGLCWRKHPVPNAHGGKTLGKVIAEQPLAVPGDKVCACPAGLLNLRQSELTKLFLREALKTGNVTVHFNSEVVGVEELHDAVQVKVNNPDILIFTGCYVVGADGGKSKVRKAIGTPCLGHTWPERLLATDVNLFNDVVANYPTVFVMDRKNYTIMTPLTKPIPGERSLWRCTIAIPPEDERSDSELMKQETIREFYETFVAGPRPLNAEITARSVYRIHQRLVTTMRKGRCILAGDAAHMNNPYGAMGLNTGLLDGDALAESLIMILLEGRSDELLTIYSDERRKVFQMFVDPTTTANKLRLHSPDPDAAMVDDYYFRAMQNPTPELLVNAARPYFETWRTDMRLLAREGDL